MSVDGTDTFTILVRWVQLILKQLKYCKAYKRPRAADKPICQFTFLYASGMSSSVTIDISAPAAKPNIIDRYLSARGLAKK